MKTLNIENYIRKHLFRDTVILNYDRYNTDYDGLDACMLGYTIKIRSGKKTPTKPGYFTTLWIKDDSGKNIAYSMDAFPDFLVIILQDGIHLGHFIFPKHMLVRYGILATDTKKGKMGFRLYTPWDQTLNHTARETQRWQAPFFHDCSASVDP